MHPSFTGPQRSRQINLGGTSTTASHESIIDGVRARRNERQDAVRRAESALKIQAWYRGRAQSRRVRAELRARFDAGSSGVAWTRCLVLAWSGGPEDEARLGRWSSSMTDQEALLAPFDNTERNTWLVLIRQISLLLIKSVAEHAQSPYTINHLTVLNILVSSKTLREHLPAADSAVASDIVTYLVSRGFYSHLSRALTQIPLERKTSTTIPPLIVLAVAPFSTLPPSSEIYLQALQEFTLHFLSIPILPNRLPITSVTFLSGRLPFASLALLDPIVTATSPHLSQEARVHLLANLLAFGPPRIPSATSATLVMYLRLITALMNSLPVGSLEPSSKKTASWGEESPSSSSDDSDDGRAARRAARISRKAQPQHPPLDSKTQLRLQTLWSSAHVSALLTASGRHPSARPHIFAFLMGLWSVWPTRKDRILSTVIGGGAGYGLTKEVYRGWVRPSPLGKEEDAKRAVEIITNPANAAAWAPFLFLTELYTHMLLTMGDDEFFSTSASAGPARNGATSAGNPLSLDELTSFSRQLLNISFPLYWHEDQANVKVTDVPGLRMKWEGVRDKTTRCLQAIQARDARRPFAPPDHWLVTSQIDMASFINAAVAEEQELDRPTPAGRVISKRQMAFISPRLGVLNNIPFAIPFATRVQIFRRFIANDMHVLGLDDWYQRPKHKATIRRKSVAQDGFDQLGGLGAALKERVAITFIDEFGSEEAGIDGGGVFKEFLTALTKEAFDTDRGLWLATAQQELYPNPHSYAKEPHQLNWYRFVGRVLGKALYEGILIDVAFASFLLSKWLGKQSYLDDLQSLDPELYQGLVFLKHYQGQVEDLALNFTVTNSEFGVASSIDLIPNGSNIAVTRENRIQYIYLVANYRLNTQIKKQSEALFEGVKDIIDPKWLRMFDQHELQILIGGVEEPVDIDDLQNNAIYGGVFDAGHPTILAFWRVARSLDQGQRQSLLRFVTSGSRPPLLGFKELNPRFSIRDAGTDNSRLPTSSTCVNLLKLPQYSNETILRQKVLQAISSNAGFDLS